MEQKSATDSAPDHGLFFHAMGDGKPYPAWRYHAWLEPIIVHNTDEDKKYEGHGYKAMVAPVGANTYLMNWRYDLEEMSARQLALFIKDEFDLDVPHEIGKEYLFKLVWQLYMTSPASRDRIVFFAQTVELDYDVAQKQIIETDFNPEDYETEEFYA